MDTELLKGILRMYKENFAFNFQDTEKTKWEAVKTFQVEWKENVPTSEFAGMLRRALSNTGSLLSSVNFYPKDMILRLADVAPQEVSEMFGALFDEDNKDVPARIETFKNKADGLFNSRLDDLNANGRGRIGSHFQNENAISTYLWLRYPGSYYIYKYEVVKDVRDKLHCDFLFERGDYTNNLINHQIFYDQICEVIRGDEDLISRVRSCLADSCSCDSDNEFKTLTIDVAYYINTKYMPNR